jgi:hypothetical protein
VNESGRLTPRTAGIPAKKVQRPRGLELRAYCIPVLFIVSLLVIIGFAGIDTFLNIKYPVRAEVEENPIARWLLQVSHNDLGLLMAVKMAGTSLASCVLVVIYQRRRDMALAIAASVALCVTTMLGYMIN